MKRLISLILASVMILSVSMVAFASEPVKSDEFVEAGKVYVEVIPHSLESEVWGPTGALPITEAYMTEYDMHTVNVDNLLEPTSAARATWTNLGGFQVYNQATQYNCGPACVQAVLAFLDAPGRSQDIIAAGCETVQATVDNIGFAAGTHIERMAAYVNGEFLYNSTYDGRGYYIVQQATIGTMKSCITTGIVNDGMPSIIGLSFREEDGWDYNAVYGHFLTVHSAKSDQSTFGLGDPWIGYSTDPNLADAPWSYTKDAVTIHDAYSARNVGLMY